MRLDLDARLTAAFIFGLVGLSGLLVASLLGRPVSEALVGGLVTLVVTTLGAGILRGSQENGT
jgi:hypothetical protein